MYKPVKVLLLQATVFLVVMLIVVECSKVSFLLKNNKKMSILSNENENENDFTIAPRLGQQVANKDYCVCVFHYLCDRNYNLITNGDGIIDPRIGPNESPQTGSQEAPPVQCSAPGQICCRVANGTNLPSTLPPVVSPSSAPGTPAPPATTAAPATTAPPATSAPTPPPTPAVTTTRQGTGTTAGSPSITLPPGTVIILPTIPPSSAPPGTPAPMTTVPPTTGTKPPATPTPGTIPTGPPPTGTSATTGAPATTGGPATTAVPATSAAPSQRTPTAAPATTAASGSTNRPIVIPTLAPPPSSTLTPMTIPTVPPPNTTVTPRPTVIFPNNTQAPPATTPTSPPVVFPNSTSPRPTLAPTSAPPVLFPNATSIAPTTAPTTAPPVVFPNATSTPLTTSLPATSQPPVVFPTSAKPGTSAAPGTAAPPVVFPTTSKPATTAAPTPATTLPPATTAAPATTAKPSTPTTPPAPGTQCGIRYIQPGRVETIEPYSTSFGEFPWMLAVLDSTAITVDGTVVRNAFVAGASLITKNVALTGAHRLRNFTNQPSNLIVRAGEWNTVTANEPLPHQDRTVQRIEIHRDFNNRTLFNDIALLKLEEPVVFANNVIPICLPDINQVFRGNCIATGWGQNAFGPSGQYQRIMRKVTLPIVDRDTCQRQFRNTRLGVGFVLDSSFLCAGGQANLDTCTGDGGGPLVCPTANGSSFIQAGIVSWGIGCGMANVSGVYVDVGLFRQWINSALMTLDRDTVPRFSANKKK